MSKKFVGATEWAVCSASMKGGEPDRVVVWERSDMRTKEFATAELQNCLALGQKAFLVSRRWAEDVDVIYEYNLRVEGKIFYTSSSQDNGWCDEDMITGLWDTDTLDGVKARLPHGWILVRRVRSEIEEV